MSKYLFNPFRYIAGWESLAAGILVLLCTSVIGYYSHIHFPDIISVKTNPGIPYYVLLVENGLNWLVPSIVLYLAALIFSSSSVRVVDILARKHWPGLLTLLPHLRAFREPSTSLDNTPFGNR